MMGRNLENRILKLETRTTRPDELLVVWRRPDGDVIEALKAATFAHGDKVICAEWFEDGPLPDPKWYSDRLSKAMPPKAYQQVERTMERIADAENATSRDRAGFAPFPFMTESRMEEMTDMELIHAIIGVRT